VNHTRSIRYVYLGIDVCINSISSRVTNIGRPRPPKLNPADYGAELTPAIDLHMLYQEAKKSNPIPADWTLAWRRRLGGRSGGLIIRPQVKM
jgi:hypothetical protein